MSGIFQFWARHRAAKAKQVEAEAADALGQIWAMDSVNDLLIALFTRVSEKCGYGADMGGLSGSERIFYITQSCEQEINNGGFSQYLFNSSGGLAGELAQAYREIGAVKTAAICGRALEALGGALPTDEAGRRALLDALPDDAGRCLEECTGAFLRYEEDLNALSHAYVRRHQGEFT